MSQAFAHRSSRLFFRNCVKHSHAFAAGSGKFLVPLRVRRPYASVATFSKRAVISAVQSKGSTSEGSLDSTSHGLSSIASSNTLPVADTIFALSSGAGVTAGVAIIRVSGPDASSCLAKLLRQSTSDPEVLLNLPRPRYASVRKLYDPTSNELLDEAMVLYFPSPRSFTGEDVVEFHVHGSRAVVTGVIEALGNLQRSGFASSMVRPAEKGEFTRRAFENGRMDLTGVEGLADLIAAETSMQRRQALRQLGGEVRDTLEAWREEIKSCLAHAEAVIDFGDDVDDDAFEAIVPRIRRLYDEIRRKLNDNHRGEIVRGGARVAIVGEPNAGKSTLLNALARRPAAIVSPQAGTTRDVVEVQLDLNGLAVIVSDTAGLRDNTSDPIELEGMRRARDAARSADITILVHDVSKGNIDDAVLATPSRLQTQATMGNNNDGEADRSLICVANKIDLIPATAVADQCQDVRVFKTSLTKDEGIGELAEYIELLLRERIEGHASGKGGASEDHPGGNAPVITRARHRHHMSLAADALQAFLDGRTGPDPALFLPMDLAAEDLRIAGKELGAITGVIHVEEVLDVIFSDFCIGK